MEAPKELAPFLHEARLFFFVQSVALSLCDVCVCRRKREKA